MVAIGFLSAIVLGAGLGYTAARIATRNN